MDYSKELSPEIREKMKKNLVYVGIFAVVMFFAGLTSAYYVNMGGGFWLKYPMPSGFYLSTLFIGCSSLFFILAILLLAAPGLKSLLTQNSSEAGIKKIKTIVWILGIAVLSITIFSFTASTLFKQFNGFNYSGIQEAISRIELY